MQDHFKTISYQRNMILAATLFVWTEKLQSRHGAFRLPKWRPSAILDYQIFANLTADSMLRVNVRHNVKFLGNRLKSLMRLWPFSRWRLSAILLFCEFKMLSADSMQQVSVRRLAKFLGNRSTRCRDTAIFRFSKGGYPLFYIIKNSNS